ncbi:hypothetical protein [Marinobacter changyiensis]|uniref:hypothetical protein n=1 Tax=Marinobacter changyiensis TaxID=2604091 RepID=UPI0012643FDB|nr:hypothetical protein [Marinobacter changyiensis]
MQKQHVSFVDLLMPKYQLVEANGERGLIADVGERERTCTRCEKTGVVLGSAYGWCRKGQFVGAYYALCSDCTVRIKLSAEVESKFLKKLRRWAPHINPALFLELPELKAGWQRETLN